MAKRPPEDIDPRTEDVAAKRRRRKHRAKPDPSPHLQAEKPKALARALKRPVCPAVMFEREGAHYAMQPTHADADLWELTLADAFATRSQSVMRSFVKELTALCSKAYDHQDEAWKPNEQELNAVLGMVASAKPQTTAEAALVAQSVAVHLLTMRLAAQALNGGGMVLDRDAALVGKLARTYAMQMDALQAMKGKGTDTGTQAGAALEQLLEQGRTAVRAGRATGINAAQAMMDSYASLVSGVLIGMSEGLQAQPQPTKAAAARARRR